MNIKKHLTGIVLALCLISTHLSSQDRAPAAPARPVFRAPMVIKSPEILPDNSVTFRLYAPKATEVFISGDWMPGYGTTAPMVKNDTGLWSVTVGPLTPELYAYTFSVNGVRTTDPNNVQQRRDGSRYESFFIVPGPASDLYVNKAGVAHGTVIKTWYKSDVLGMQRRLYVYTPAGYEQGDRKYPVFYLLHGGGGDEDAWTTMGRTAQILDNLIAQGKARPMLIVMPNGNANQAAAQNDIPLQHQMNLADYQNLAGKFEESLAKEIVPFIDKNFRTYSDKQHRAIAGLSMGGMHTQNTTFNYPEVFDYIGVFSMGIANFGRQDEAERLAKERDEKIEALKKSGYRLYWIACGTEDFVYSGVTGLRKILDSHQFRYVYRESTGGHTWANWRIYLSEFAPMLFKADAEYRMRSDWPDLGRFSEENLKLGPPAKNEKRVVFMGNSITIGWINTVPEFFSGRPFVNRGISGQTTPQMLVRFRPDVIDLKPSAVVILAGINDIAGNTGPSTLHMIQSNLSGMVEMARANNIKVVLCSVLPAADFPWRPGMDPADKVVELNKWIKNYAASNGCVYVDYYSAMVDEKKGLKAEYTFDGVHPNKAGYEVMQPLVEEGLRKALKK